MRHAVLATVMALGVGCSSGDTDTVDDGGCGAVTVHTLSVRAKVVDAADQPVAGASVRLEERNWEPGVLGEATTDAAGEATLEDLSITSVEGCWGTALDYVLVATEGSRTAEVPLNPSLFNAVDSGATELDRRDRPVVLPD